LGQMVRLGCKWEIVLTCVTCYHTYNATQRVVRPARYAPDGELSDLPQKVWEPEKAARPPNLGTRSKITSNLTAAVGEIARHEDLLSALARFDPPPQTEWTDPLTEGDIRHVRITADEAVLYVQKLLLWCGRLLSDDSIGNFKTVESVNQLIPCVYVEVVAPKPNTGRMQRLALQPVADLLNATSGEQRHNQGQLRIALNRFERDYPRVYRALRAKIEDLHRTASEPAEGWRRLFETEDRRRRLR
jgi:hypothetical protein